MPLLKYEQPRRAEWPKAEFVIGNPPFLGNKRMREHLGDGYSETLRRAHPEVPESADFVMYWWEKAARRVRRGDAKRFGLITTNSLRQTFNRKVLDFHMHPKDSPSEEQPPLSLLFAIPDHPWVDTAEGAAVRIAMTVGSLGERVGNLLWVLTEEPLSDGSCKVTFDEHIGKIGTDLRIGADVTSAVELKANTNLSNQGVTPLGTGFRLTPTEASDYMKGDQVSTEVVKPYAIGRDIVQEPEPKFIIDFFGLSAESARSKYPALFQHVLNTVKPERDQKERGTYRDRWWIFAEPRANLRPALSGLPRYIATCRTAKHRIFTFLEGRTLPDAKIVAIALQDAFFLGVLSGVGHVTWALATGARLGVGNDPNYNHSECFAKFPFPACDDAAKDRIRKIAEELDAHRKRVQAQSPGLTLTGMYNVLEKLRANQPLNEKEQRIHDQGLVSVLCQLHDELDAAVFAAYGWPATLTDAEILERLVALNAERAKEEANGLIRWLRPEYQNPTGAQAQQTALAVDTGEAGKTKEAAKKDGKMQWPKSLSERVKAVSVALASYKEPVTPETLAKRFLRAKPKDISEILETLCTMGHAHKGKSKGTYLP